MIAFAGPTRSLLVAASAGLLGLSLLVSACGGSPASDGAQLTPTTTDQSSTSSAGSGNEDAALASALAFSRCMRSHGVPSFPDPDAQGEFPAFRTSVPKQISAAADGACKHLVARGGGAGTPQNREAKLAFALNVARCLRSHGFPNFPDPTVSGQGMSENLSGAGIDSSSPQFQTAEAACEKQGRGRP